MNTQTVTTTVPKIIVKTESNLPTVDTVDNTAWGSEGVDRSDLIMPKILVMQSNSNAVSDGKALPGALLHTELDKAIGDGKVPLPVIPIYIHKTYEYSEKEEGKFKTKKVEPFNPLKHDALCKAYYGDLAKTKRHEMVYNVYAFLEADTEKATGDFLPPPSLVRFRSFARKNGMKLGHHFNICKMGKIPPAKKTFGLLTTKTQNDLGTFFVLDVTPLHETKNWDNVKLNMQAWANHIHQSINQVIATLHEEEEATTDANGDRVPF